MASAGSRRRSDLCSGIPALVALGDPGSTLHSLGLPSTTSLPDKVLAVEEAEPSLAMVGLVAPAAGRQESAGLCAAEGGVHCGARGVLFPSSDAKQPSGKMNTFPRHTV